MVDGVLAELAPRLRGWRYPINKHCIVRCIKRVTREDPRSGKHIRWYLTNAPVPGSGWMNLSIIRKNFRLPDNEEGVWIRSMRNMIGLKKFL